MTENLEQPRFKIIEKYKGFEIRKYTDTIQAQVASPTSKRVSSSIHFREIADYIFGNNHVSIDLVKGIFYYTYSSDDYKVFLSINIEFNT